MFQHLRSSFWLLILTLVLCSVVYPLTLWAIGRTFFSHQADGSLVTNKDGKPVGSLLIAQPFNDGKYFQPRPSATTPSYNAAASGASNWGANNPLLRDRVARQLGPMVKYKSGQKKGQKVGPDIEAWFKDKTEKDPQYLENWAGSHSAVAGNWATSDDNLKAFILDWAEKHPEVTADWFAKKIVDDSQYLEKWAKEHTDVVGNSAISVEWIGKHPEVIADWRKDHPDDKPQASDIVQPFLKSFAATYPGAWLCVVSETDANGKTSTTAKPVKASSDIANDCKDGNDIQAGFFDAWLQDNPNVDLVQVPADMVMASGSGLDPHITRKNADYQLDDHVADAWTTATKGNPGEVRKKIVEVLDRLTFRPLGGLAGEELVNVLEVNLALEDQFK